MKYEIDINNDDHDAFEKNADNVGVLQVFNDKGNDITKQSTVSLFLSENALLGLGEFLAYASNMSISDWQTIFEIEPAIMKIFYIPVGTDVTS